MKRAFLLLSLPLVANCSWSQLTDDFSDGNLNTNPAWTGTTADFIVNASDQLQISNTVAATSYLSAPHGLATLAAKEWRIWIKQSFAPSAANFGRIYLAAASPDLTTNPDGFFLQLGEAGSLDAIRLNRSVGGTVTEICAGTGAQIATSFSVGLRIVRDAAGNWSLYADATGGTNYTLQASGTDASDLTGTHFGVLGTYTVSNATKFYYDNIYVGDEIVDSQAPALVSATAVSASEVDLLFDEPVTGTAVMNPGNYTLNPAVSVASAVLDATNDTLVHLVLSGSLQNGQNYQLTVAAAEDLGGNTAANLAGSFTYLVSEVPAAGDIVISEFFCDPTPVIGLAEAEFVEIHNRSNKYFDLSGWKLGDAAAAGTITAGWIAPGEYKILCAASSLAHYPAGFAVTSFPSLNNSGDAIVLKDTALNRIDSLLYTDAWYNDAVKQEGGYTLELINPADPCSDAANWTASNSPSGGTPGMQNSVYDATPDTEIPVLAGTHTTAPNLLELTFSEGIDPATLAAATLITAPPLTIAGFDIAPGFPHTMTVAFGENLAVSQLYTFTLGPAADCWTNAATFNGAFALAELPAAGDLVINELLFDPGTGGTDFVELYNRSQKIIDLENCSIATFDDGAIAHIQPIAGSYLLFPDAYVVLTADSVFQENQFPAAIPGTYYPLALPALGNDSGTVYLLYDTTLVIDRVPYKADWHLSLIDDTENKTLERIDPAGASAYSGNWHTAAETTGFGTPGGRNSQYQAGGISGTFGTLQPLFSPDNDGFEDVLQFFYTMPQPGMIATLKIFDDQGRLIREVFRSELLGKEGNVTWDGVNDDDAKAALGVYLGVIEAFSADGKANYSKRVAFTLAGKLD